ncbi:restriction endonuclease subunit S [Lactobacillus helveticus]|uniref:restriction endonuclease subunit S n=2 Tax=Lactobacillales TaxID=186826 RepID=UPI0011085010|nr:restriction endonuclease subunit S [Lactobacillus helveticus]TLQ22657.1 restriction endonuclease subunit S [Lactobacillus helveticus]
MAKIADSVKKKVPELRFPGFTDDWEDRKLRDLLNKNSEKNKNLSVINVESVSNKTGFTKQTDQFEDYSVASADLSNYYVIREKQFAYNPSRINVGSIAYKDLGDEISVVSPLYVSFSTKKVLNDGFLWNWFKTASFDAQRQRLSEGGVRDTLSFNQLSEMNTMFPTYPEQEKIGSFFQQLDETIALHQRKLDLLKEQKKGYLQKMFPKNGAKVPELRFAGFADDWEERKLGELSNIVGGGTPSTSNPEYWDGDIDWYAPAEIGEQSYVSKSKKTITELGLKKSSARILPVGTVLFTSRAGIGNTAILAKEATTNQGFQSIVPDQNKLDSYFIFSRTNELKRYGEVTGAGSTFVEISGKQMSKMSIMVPELSEQQKIGSFFKQLDDTIALHQRKLDLLKEQKKGFLQKMFV